MKIDKEQRHESLHSLNASEKRYVKIMVRGMTKMEMLQLVGKKRESMQKKGLMLLWPVLENKNYWAAYMQAQKIELNLNLF